MTFKDCMREALQGNNAPEVTRTKLVDDFTEFIMLFGGLIERMPAELKQKLVAKECPSDVVVNKFMDATQGMPRAFVWMALTQMVGITLEEWREEEQLLTRPVQ